MGALRAGEQGGPRTAESLWVGAPGGAAPRRVEAPAGGAAPGSGSRARGGLSVGCLRYALPQPYEDLGHTADVGVRVRGATAEEALARLALALGTLLTGGVAPGDRLEERVRVAGGPGLAGTAVALLRELLFRFATERLVPAEVEVLSLDERGAEASVGFARHEPEERGEGADVKAVTWHAARLERDGAGWVAQAVFDI